MYRIRKVIFERHKVLGNLELDFCDKEGNAVDTVIFAGDNGCGKSTILNELYDIACHKVKSPVTIELEDGNTRANLNYYWNESSGGYMYIRDRQGLNAIVASSSVSKKYPFHGVFSDVDINFTAANIQSVTSLELDSAENSRRSAPTLPKDVKQLIVDIQALDDAEIARFHRTNPVETYENAKIKERMPRFIEAFKKIFSDINYSAVENKHGHKEIVFVKNGKRITIDDLSSGEKQIVYRGCFLLKDVNALNGAFVFIDEPEISLHPSWQEKIMDYYKGIFTNAEGQQTSQIFAVTHSPFIIHNKSRKNDKVIVLSRDNNGDIVVQDKPEYYKCDSMSAVQDAFSISGFSLIRPTVYLEGRTDEKYFNKAVEVFGLNDLPFEFKWVGHIDDNGNESNTGKDSLNKAVAFLIGRNLSQKNVCLFDCDTSKIESDKNNVYTRVIPTYPNSKNMKKGVENALVLDDVDISSYYSKKIKEGDYGDYNEIVTLEKMALCNAICAMNNELLKQVFIHLKEAIDRLIQIYK